MAFCRNCGTEIDETAKFCPACGKPAAGGDSSAKNKAEEKFKEISDTNDYTSEYTQEDIDNNKIIALFAYLGLLILVPVFGAKDSKFARFHVCQGLNLILADAVYIVASAILTTIFAWIPIVAEIVAAVLSLGGVLMFVLIIIGIYNAVNGKAKELPLIGSFRPITI